MTVSTDDANDQGWRKWKCARCGKLTGFTPHGPERIIYEGCNGLPLANEWGHWLALFLEAFGITKARYQAAKRIVGLGGSCSCANREQKLNTIGQRFAAWLHSSSRLLAGR